MLLNPQKFGLLPVPTNYDPMTHSKKNIGKEEEDFDYICEENLRHYDKFKQLFD